MSEFAWVRRTDSALPYQLWKPFPDDVLVEVKNVYGESRLGRAGTFMWSYHASDAEGTIDQARRLDETMPSDVLINRPERPVTTMEAGATMETDHGYVFKRLDGKVSHYPGKPCLNCTQDRVSVILALKAAISLMDNERSHRETLQRLLKDHETSLRQF